MHRTFCALAALAAWLAAPFALAEETNWSAKTPTKYEDGVTPITAAEPIKDCTFQILAADGSVLKSIVIPVANPLGGETITTILSPTSAQAALAKSAELFCSTPAAKGVSAVVQRTFRGLRLGKPTDVSVDTVPAAD